MPVAVEEAFTDGSSVLAGQSRLASSTVRCEKRATFPSSDYGMYVGTMRTCCLRWLVLSSACKIFHSFDEVII